MRDNTHFSQIKGSIHQKSFAGMHSIEDVRGERISWDAVSQQELLARPEDDEGGAHGGCMEAMVRHGLGKGGHVLVYSPCRHGEHSTTLLLNVRWAAAIIASQPAPCTTAVTLQAQITASRLDRCR